MVRDFKNRGVPIDGVGLQLHLPRLDYDTGAIAANMERLTKLGLQVHITELDVALPVDPQGAPLDPKTSSARQTPTRAWFGRVCKFRAAPRFKPGDSATSTPGLVPTRLVRRALACSLTAPTSPGRLTTQCSKNSQPGAR
jgi:hypothetical protein